MASEPLTLMTVHAHPDDEVVFTGGLLALSHDQGVRTVLVMCTNGEEGEIHDPDLDSEAARPDLAAIRRRELAGAVRALNIDQVEYLDYRDSGMAGTAPNQNPASFHQADKDAATARLVALIRRYRPQVLITYDENGAYGHPDHIAANVITRQAFDRAGDAAYRPDLGAPFQPAKLYYCAWNDEGWKQAREMYIARGLKWPWDREEEHKDDDPATVSGEEEARDAEAAAEEKPPEYVPPPVTTRIDVRAYGAHKVAAMRSHRTQFDPNGLFYNMPEDIAEVAWGAEHLSRVRCLVAAPDEEDDVFAGLRG